MSTNTLTQAIPGYGFKSLMDECEARGLPVTLNREAVGFELAVWLQDPPRALEDYRRAKRLPPAGILIAVEHMADIATLDAAANRCRRAATLHDLMPPPLTAFDLDDICGCGCPRYEHSPGDGHCFHYHACGCVGLR